MEAEAKIQLIKLVHEHFYYTQKVEDFIHQVITSQDRNLYFWNNDLYLCISPIQMIPIEKFIIKIADLGYSVKLKSSVLIISEN